MELSVSGLPVVWKKNAVIGKRVLEITGNFLESAKYCDKEFHIIPQNCG